MRPADWKSVRQIYLEGIATGQATFEARAPGWKKWDEGHRKRPRLVAVENGRVMGWAAVSPVSRRSAYAGVAEVSVYVAANARGRGIGRALLARLAPAAEEAGIWTLQAGIFRRTKRVSRSIGPAAFESSVGASASAVTAESGATCSSWSAAAARSTEHSAQA